MEIDNELIDKIASGKVVKERIKGHLYEIYYDESRDVVIASPSGKGDKADSSLEAGDYKVTHAGKIYKEVQDLVWDIDRELREKWKD